MKNDAGSEARRKRLGCITGYGTRGNFKVKRGEINSLRAERWSFQARAIGDDECRESLLSWKADFVLEAKANEQ
jgi:hypothetical protein